MQKIGKDNMTSGSISQGKADFLCYDSIIVEIKAATFIHNDNKRQTINYLNAVNKPVGLLINFGEASLKWKRFINSKALPSA